MATRPRTSRKSAPRPSVPEGMEGTFLAVLPLQHARSTERRVNTERSPLYSSNDPRTSVVLLVRLELESFGLFKSLSGGTPTMPVSDHFHFAGLDRYVILGKKVRGVARKLLASSLREKGCEDSKPCGICEFCHSYGFFLDGGNSRIRYLDFWSVRERPSAPVMMGSRALDPKLNYIEDAEMVAPGTQFLGAVRIINPSQMDIANTLMALEEAGAEGIGSRTTHYGRASATSVALLGGSWRTFSSVQPVLRRMAEGRNLEDALGSYIEEDGEGLASLSGPEMKRALRALVRLSPLHPAYGNWEMEKVAQPTSR